MDINGYSVRNSRCILIPDMKAFDLQWHPGNVYNFCWFSSGREPSPVRRKFSLEVLTRVSDIGRTWIKKIICLLIFPLLYCQVMLSTVTPIITKSSSSARGIRQLQIAVRLTSQWSGKCAVKWIKTTNKRQWEISVCFPSFTLCTKIKDFIHYHIDLPDVFRFKMPPV